MGSVYEVESRVGEKLAAKVISRAVAGDNPATLLRFAREAKAATAIQSPNVVRTLDAGSDQRLGLPYIIMELLHGTDLSKVMREKGALEPTLAVRLVLQAARGIAAAHATHIVHRDIKPANLFLDIDESSRQVTVKVCDFGIAKRKRIEEAGSSRISHMNLTRTGSMLGSPMYVAPEQARNAKSADERADVWSLSVVLWEALSGQRLWGDKRSLGELLVSIYTAPIKRLEDLAPWVPWDLAEAVHQGLERDLQQRTPSMTALIAALEPFAAGTDRLTADELVGLSEETKAELTRRASTPEQRISRSQRLTPAPNTAPAKPEAQRPHRGLLIGLLLLVTIGAAAALVLTR
jgi:serine/threonine-protein kinase